MVHSRIIDTSVIDSLVTTKRFPEPVRVVVIYDKYIVISTHLISSVQLTLITY